MDHNAIQKWLSGRYRIERELGRGGMGVVYQAFQDSQQRRVALKIVSTAPVDDLDWAERLAQEARLAARLAHPNVVRVYEFDRLGDAWAMIAFELVEGESLRSMLEHESPLTAARTRELGAGLAAGLEAIHAAGILHRDLKPENVLLSEHGPKITDLGIAKDLFADRLKTSSGLMLGTPPYMAPELIQGLTPITGALDVYALGCVLFEMVTGQLPFQETHVAELLLAHVNAPPPNPSDLRGGIPADLSGLILECLAKRPAARPTAAQLVERLAPGDSSAPPTPVPARGTVPNVRSSAFDAGRSAATSVVGISTIDAVRAPTGTVPLNRSAVLPLDAPPMKSRAGLMRGAALVAGGAAALLALRFGGTPARGRLAVPGETVSLAAQGLDRERALALPGLLERLTAMLAAPLASDLRMLLQAQADKYSGLVEAPEREPLFPFWNDVERAAKIQGHLQRTADLALILAERYRPAELGLVGLRQLGDALVLRVELDRVWAFLIDDAAITEAIVHQTSILNRLAILKRPEPTGVAIELKVMRARTFNACAPPLEAAFRTLFSELELAGQRPLPDFERFQTCWRALALIKDVSDVDNCKETAREPFFAQIRPEPAVLQRDPYAAALMAAVEAARSPNGGYFAAAATFGKRLPPTPHGRYQSPLWQSILDLARLFPFPFSVPRALERRPRT